MESDNGIHPRRPNSYQFWASEIPSVNHWLCPITRREQGAVTGKKLATHVARFFGNWAALASYVVHNWHPVLAPWHKGLNVLLR